MLSFHPESSLPRLGGNFRVLDARHIGRRGTRLEVGNKLTQSLITSLRLALNLEMVISITRSDRVPWYRWGKTHCAIRGIGDEAGEANAVGLLPCEVPEADA
jgi:hypothetical protein